MVQGARRGQPKEQLPVRRGGLFERNMFATKAISSKLFVCVWKKCKIEKKESMKWARPIKAHLKMQAGDSQWLLNVDGPAPPGICFEAETIAWISHRVVLLHFLQGSLAAYPALFLPVLVFSVSQKNSQVQHFVNSWEAVGATTCLWAQPERIISTLPCWIQFLLYLNLI